MKSGKQRRRERERERLLAAKRSEGVAVNVEKLAPNNSYGTPDFVARGYYVDKPFTCEGCGLDQVWTATQQKWWYEVAKGYVYSTAKLCRSCRRCERERRSEARRIHLEGVARKKGGK
jgi:hypothetical protein